MSLPPIAGSPSLLKALQKALQHNVSSQQSTFHSYTKFAKKKIIIMLISPISRVHKFTINFWNLDIGRS